MYYEEALELINQKNICPFCTEKHEHKLYENEHMYIIPARAPYIEDHLLIIPKRHVIFLHELSHEELQSMHALINKRTKKLHKKYADVNLLLRDGTVDSVIGKSINHLHFHLVPNCSASFEGRNNPTREFLSEEDYLKLIEGIKQEYK